jgi:outer membrane protein OmpA-like peptidoglycan-associated protein
MLKRFSMMLLACSCVPAFAQGPNVQHFRPALPGQNLVQTQGSQTQDHPFSASFYINYADQPLEFTGNNGQLNFIEGVFTWDASLTFSLFPRVDLNVAYQFSPLLKPNNALSTLVDDRGLGDMMVRALITLKEQKTSAVGLAVLPTLVFPTGSDADYLGHPGFGLGTHLVVDQQLGRFYHAFNLGFMYRTEQAQLANLTIEHQWMLQYGASYDFETCTLGAELAAITDASSPFTDAVESPIEASVFVRKQASTSTQWLAGVGKGLTRGYGAPSWRVFAGITYTPQTQKTTPTAGTISETVLDELRRFTQEKQTAMTKGRDQSYFHGKAVHFEQNQKHLMPESLLLLQDLVDWLANEPNISVTLIGHTDQTGSDAYNQRLSLARAEHVKQFLVIQGLDASSIQVQGQGATQPKYQEDTDYQRLLNRRVEIFLNTL